MQELIPTDVQEKMMNAVEKALNEFPLKDIYMDLWIHGQSVVQIHEDGEVKHLPQTFGCNCGRPLEEIEQ